MFYTGYYVIIIEVFISDMQYICDIISAFFHLPEVSMSTDIPLEKYVIIYIYIFLYWFYSYSPPRNVSVPETSFAILHWTYYRRTPLFWIHILN